MDINTALSSEIEVRRNIRELARGQADSGDVKTSADDLAVLLRRLSDIQSDEIEKLIDALQALRKQLPRGSVCVNVAGELEQ